MRVSMLLRPCDVSKMTSGSAPISLPMLCASCRRQCVLAIFAGRRRDTDTRREGGLLGAHICQYFSIADVESMMVPSMSNKRPWKEALTGGAEYSMWLGQRCKGGEDRKTTRHTERMSGSAEYCEVGGGPPDAKEHLLFQSKWLEKASTSNSTGLERAMSEILNPASPPCSEPKGMAKVDTSKPTGMRRAWVKKTHLSTSGLQYKGLMIRLNA